VRYAQAGSRIDIHLSHQGEQVQVRVCNQGETIAPQHLERLFERFYRADSARAQSDTHHGLGLSIVRAIANMHGGQVFALSQQGTNTFGFSLARNP